jgi:N-acyl-phosphatidylethanolamine-hydrolysing phospholipase D
MSAVSGAAEGPLVSRDRLEPLGLCPEKARSLLPEVLNSVFRVIRLGSILGLLTLALVPATTLDVESAGGQSQPAHHLRRGFRNLDDGYHYDLGVRVRHFLLSGFAARPPMGKAPVVLGNDGAALRANGTHPTVTWVGHSTFLVQLEGVNILTDPHWGDRASPVGFTGPRRLVPPGLRFGDLPPVHAVLISHDHYDHLDAETVDRLAREHHPRFFVPLGLRAWLAERGITDVVELDWWDSVQFDGLSIVCTLAQHSSGRGLTDQNLRLWSSWVVVAPAKRFFFAGDTGYDPRLKVIGERFGPFDLAAIPIGGYSSFQTGHPNHVNPEEAIQLFEDIRGRLLVPMHWGTFAMNREPFREPPDRLLREALRRGIEEQVAILSPGESIPW